MGEGVWLHACLCSDIYILTPHIWRVLFQHSMMVDIEFSPVFTEGKKIVMWLVRKAHNCSVGEL